MAGSINSCGPPPYNRAIHNLQSPNERSGVVDGVNADILKSYETEGERSCKSIEHSIWKRELRTSSSDIGVVKYYLYWSLGDARP